MSDTRPNVLARFCFDDLRAFGFSALKRKGCLGSSPVPDAPSFFGPFGFAALGVLGSAGAAGVVDAAGVAGAVGAAGVTGAGVAGVVDAAGVAGSTGVAAASGAGLDCSSSAILQVRFKLYRP